MSSFHITVRICNRLLLSVHSMFSEVTFWWTFHQSWWLNFTKIPHRHMRCMSQNTLRDKSTRDTKMNILGIFGSLRLEKTSKAIKFSHWPSTTIPTKPHCKEWEFASSWNVGIPWQQGREHIPHTGLKMHLKQKQVKLWAGTIISLTAFDDSYCTWNCFLTRQKWKATSKMFMKYSVSKKIHEEGTVLQFSSKITYGNLSNFNHSLWWAHHQNKYFAVVL